MINDFLLIFVLIVAVTIAISSLDDLLIDLLATGIVRSTSASVTASHEVLLPLTGVFVANWHEEDVLGQMVEGNLARISCENVVLHLGVYPNDTGTLNVAKALEARHSHRVKVIVNTLDGPTSKGQMLNEMFRQVYGTKTAEGNDEVPEIAVLHDSEDVIDPRTFPVYAAYTNAGYDFVQVPVFSLSRKKGERVAATYMDEFAERHTRELVVRDAVGAMIPSAGVGTGMTKRLLRHFLATRNQVLMSGTVTEDYILGVEAKRSGFKSAFAALSADEVKGYDFIATREFFPRTLQASIKQKTRWVYGINFEAMHKLGWAGDGWDKYFFMRDRKGIVTNFLPPVSLALCVGFYLGFIDLSIMDLEWKRQLVATIYFNLFALLVRYVVRVKACQQVYGTWDWIGIALRWPVSLYINMAAAFGAWRIYFGESQFATRPIVWSKTAHELPPDFINVKR